jgi:sugar lactone lactonase YvrE
MSLLLFVLHCLAVTSPIAVAPAQTDGDGPLVETASIELTGVDGRIDHLAIDLKRERLFVAAVGNNSVEVVDLKGGRVQKSIRELKQPQGILYLDDIDRMVVASGVSGTVDVYDGDKLEKLASVEVGEGPDNLRYDPRTQRVYVAYGDGALGIIDAKTWKLEASIALQSHPEAFQLSPDGKLAFVNVPHSQQFAVVDLDARKLVTTWAVGEAKHNYAMALIPPSMGQASESLLLMGCRSPAKLVMRWAESGKPAGVVDLSDDVDDLAVDAKRRRVYASCGGGRIDVFAVDEKLAVKRIERVVSVPGARTCLFVPERNQLFVAVPIRPPQRAEIRIYAVGD